jgi:hypothetical protein
MIILLILVVSIIIALIRHGKLSRFADIHLRWRGIIILGFLVQVLIFSNSWQASPDLKPLTPYLYIASMGLLLAALVPSFHIPGMRLITFGLCLNFVAILFNGGYMPASPEAFALAGHSGLSPGQVTNNSIVMHPGTQLFFLCDIFAIPKGFIFPNVFSIGDVLLTIGAVYLTQKALVVSPHPPPA